MNYYQEITLLPNADISLYFLWQKMYQQIHLALVENKSAGNISNIGVGFPEYNADKFSLGSKLRLFAENKELLERVQAAQWMRRLRDYVHTSSIRNVPEKIIGHVCFKHIKFKGNKEKLARRRAKRKGEPFQEALKYYNNFKESRSKLPYLNMHSLSNGQRFRLFIEKQKVEHAKQGKFSCYGLSKVATVPCF